jgi:Flp pilus assembly protein TadG
VAAATGAGNGDEVGNTVRRRTLAAQGQATVEFAIVLPIVLLMVVGIIEFGKAFNYWLSINHIADETARWAAVDKLPPANTMPTVENFQSYARDQAQNQELRDKIDDNPALVCYEPSGGGGPGIGDAATVRVRVPYELPLGIDVWLAGSSTVRFEQIPFDSWPTCT